MVYSVSDYIHAVFKTIFLALAGVAQWIECWPANRKVTGSITSGSACLVCSLGPRLGVCERQRIHVSLTHCCFSPSLSPSRPLILKINK